jgi:hypothetical protein
MKRFVFVLLFGSFSVVLFCQSIYWGDEVPQQWTGEWVEKYLTTPEKSAYRYCSSHRDVLEFINTMRWNSEQVHTINMFTTTLGRTGVAAVLANPRVSSVREARLSGKPVIYLQGNIHPPEAEAMEALQMVMRDILMGDKGHLLDNQILIICPDFNPDGTDNLVLNHETPHMIGDGRNGQGLNLNRDGIKLESPEVNGLNRTILNRWDPVLFYDGHAMSRVKHGYAICYATSTIPTAHPGPRDYVWDNLFPAVQKQVRDNFQLETFTHCMMDEQNWPPTVWTHELGYWFQEGKFVANAFGLRNRMAVLCETPGHPKFERRIYAQYAYITELLEYTNQHGKEMMDLCAAVDRAVVETVESQAASGKLQAFVNGKYESYGEIELLAYEKSESEYIPGTSIRGNKSGTAEGPPEVISGVEHIAKPVGTETAMVPRGYLLPPELAWITEKLIAHNIQFEQLKEPLTVSGQVYQIDSLRHINWMGFRLTRLDGEFIPVVSRTYPAGSIHIDLAQPIMRLAFYCLEPETRDGFLGWGLFDEELEKRLNWGNREYPVFKYLKVQ